VTARELLGKALADHRAGRVAEAERAYREILREQPANADALHLLGLVELGRGDRERARALLSAAVEAAPGHAPAWFNLGGACDALGDTEGAIAAYERAVRAAPESPDGYVNLGNCYRKAERFDDALAAYEAALARDPAHPLALVSKGAVLAGCGRADEAVEVLERSIRAAPGLAIARRNLANALLQAGRLPQALDACTAALAAEDVAEARVLLGQTLAALGRFDEARTELERALAMDPNSADAPSNLSALWYVLGDAERAASYGERAVAADPGSVRAHFNLAVAYLLGGRFREGWTEFEWRMRDRARAAEFRYAALPAWDGGRFDGKRLFVSNEQGLGDAIFVARYLPMVAALGGETIVETPPELRGLFARMPGVTAYDAARGPYPADAIDLQCPAFSLPRAFGTVESSIPHAVPYVRAGEGAIARWRERLRLRPDTLNAGIVWAGSQRHRLDRFRSCSLRDVEPLGSVEGVRWFSLQKGPHEADLAGARFRPEPLGAQIADFDDTAAIVSQLDLVVTVDTSVAHLAGALAVPVWTLLGLGTDWRWQLGRDDSPWYPTMRLFRQSTGRWETAVAAVAAALQTFARDRGR
jgi:tetratricopeptide (TPR) repeat protein